MASLDRGILATGGKSLFSRRTLIAAAFVSINSRGEEPAIAIPVRLILDTKARIKPSTAERFWSGIWPEAVSDLASCGVRIESSTKKGEIWRPPHREPVISGLERGVLNVVLTDQVPVQWDNGMALNGVTTLYRGFHLSMIALNEAHGHQIPFLSLNTCVHELLHAVMLDILENRPKGAQGQQRELRIDYLATRIWLLGDTAEVRASARLYRQRLKENAALPLD